MVRLALPLLPLAGLPERLGPGKFDQAPQMPDEDLPVTRLRDEVYGTPVERHAF